MMQKNPLKKCALLLLLLLAMGVSGLILGFIDSNRNYERSLAHIQYLQANLGNLHGQLLKMNEESILNEKKYARVDFLEYQSTIFQKKFPDFSEIVNIAYNKSKVFGFQPNLILAVMQVESAFNPLALSAAGAYGLMQIRYAVWKDELNIDKGRIFDIAYNIDLGLRILKQYYDLSGGNIERALFLYNNGYKYQNSGYITKVNNSIYNQDIDTVKLETISQ
ncbi:MAG: lytic transglycosylase domain-containing protein [Chrysiogenales bacterium]